MINQLYLKIGCVLVTGVLIAMVVHQASIEPSAPADNPVVQHSEVNPASLELGKIAPGGDPLGANSGSVDSGDAKSAARPTEISLRVGKIAATPGRDEISTIQNLPMLDAEINRMYAGARAATCRILTPGAAVIPNVTPPQPHQPSTIGRIPSITVGLEMASEGRSKLPAVTRGQVDAYFQQHRLSIQPVVYCDASGQYYFGTDCQAAFFEVERPGTALQPEPMVESAVARFRSLGVFRSVQNSMLVSKENATSDSAPVKSSAGRTLVMAFTFEKSNQLVSGVGGGDRQATELILFHLPERSDDVDVGASDRSAAPDVGMEVFITSDDRRTLNRLDLQSTDVNSPLPTISADIRFDKMILMGMYPSEPVVTQIHYRSAGVLSMELVQRLINGTGDRASMELSEILDQFTLLSQSLSALARKTRDIRAESPSLEGSDAADEAWYQELSRRKHDQLNQSLQPIQKQDGPY